MLNLRLFNRQSPEHQNDYSQRSFARLFEWPLWQPHRLFRWTKLQGAPFSLTSHTNA